MASVLEKFNDMATLVATVTNLLVKLNPLRLNIKRLYLDRGFYSVPVIRWLNALKLPYILPAVIRGKQGGTRALLCGQKLSHTLHPHTPYTLNSPVHGRVTCQMSVAVAITKGIMVCTGCSILSMLFIGSK